MSNAKYYICQKIDEPKRYIGLPLDEFLPIVVIVTLFFFFGSLMIGFFVAGGVFFLIRHLKKGQGSNWLFNLMYWHLPLHLLDGVLFLKTPASKNRHYLH